jgi:undecaprenyl-diphosphatase
MLAFIAERDQLIMRRVHRWFAPRWIRLWMVYATRGGDGWLWYALGLLLVLLGGDTGRLAAAQSAVATASGVVLFLWMKRKAGRRRPCALEPHCWSTLLPPDQFSFPSGHTITAFAVCMTLIAHYPEAQAALLFCALSIAASRILLGMHFLSDVLAGAVIGTLLSALSRGLVRL